MLYVWEMYDNGEEEENDDDNDDDYEYGMNILSKDRMIYPGHVCLLALH